MRWIRRAWDGPFKTPPVEHPISVGWVLLKIIETLWRAFLIACALVALVTASYWITLQDPLSSQVRVALGNGGGCREDGYPIHARFANQSSRTIGEIDVRFRVYPQGKSDTFSGSSHELHDILRPDEEIGYCFPMPDLQPGSAGPYTVAAEVTYAEEVSGDVPVTAKASPPIITPVAEGQRAAPRTGWTKVGDWIGAMVGLVLFFCGGYGLIALVDRVFKTQMQDGLFNDDSDQRGCAAVFVIGLINAGIVSGGSYALSAIGWDGWINQVDNWSRAKGFADGGVMLLAGIVCQWPWAILLALGERRPAMSEQ